MRRILLNPSGNERSWSIRSLRIYKHAEKARLSLTLIQSPPSFRPLPDCEIPPLPRYDLGCNAT